LLSGKEQEKQLQSICKCEARGSKVAKGWDVATLRVNVPDEDTSMINILHLPALS
jgi:hypothetical protein